MYQASPASTAKERPTSSARSGSRPVVSVSKAKRPAGLQGDAASASRSGLAQYAAIVLRRWLCALAGELLQQLVKFQFLEERGQRLPVGRRQGEAVVVEIERHIVDQRDQLLRQTRLLGEVSQVLPPLPLDLVEVRQQVLDACRTPGSARPPSSRRSPARRERCPSCRRPGPAPRSPAPACRRSARRPRPAPIPCPSWYRAGGSAR